VEPLEDAPVIRASSRAVRIAADPHLAQHLAGGNERDHADRPIVAGDRRRVQGRQPCRQPQPGEGDQRHQETQHHAGDQGRRQLCRDPGLGHGHATLHADGDQQVERQRLGDRLRYRQIGPHQLGGQAKQKEEDGRRQQVRRRKIQHTHDQPVLSL
jgi:hypothetical protein